MQSKFYTLVLSLALAIVPIVGRVSAQSEKPSSITQVREGYIRFWNMLPVSSGAVSLRRLPSNPSDPALFTASGYSNSSYVGFPPAKYRLGLFKSADIATPLKTIEVDLKQDTYFTILLSTKTASLGLEVIGDTLDPTVTNGALAIHNFFPGSIVSASTTDRALGGPIAYGQSYLATGLPVARVAVQLAVRLPDGAIIHARTAPDFTASSHATLLMLPDSYGKFSPVITLDGKNL